MFQQSLVDPAVTNGIPIRVRCGLHLGVLERRDNDYFGTPVNRTARIMSVAHGGQILISQAVVDEVGDPPARADHAARSRQRPAEGPGVARARLPGRSIPTCGRTSRRCARSKPRPTTCPSSSRRSSGASASSRRPPSSSRARRLLTLLGMGGLGKTRLSLQIAADMLDAYPDGIWFMDLAPIRDPTLRPQRGRPGARRARGAGQAAHAHAVRAPEVAQGAAHLRQLRAGGERLRLARQRDPAAAPDVRIIASSREALRVPGEQIYPVLPLALPAPTASVETLSRSEAVQLFMARAQLQKPGFMLTEREAPAVAELVARVEGIPLALELAAARMRSLSIQEINKRLHNRFTLLTGGGRVLLERQQTLRALVAWSYDLLTDNEKLLFDRLGVFVGGFDLPAAEAVCGADPLMPEDVLDLVTVARRQVARHGPRDGRRIALPDAGDAPRIRARSAGQARRAGRDRDAALRPLPRRGEGGEQGLQGPEQAEWTRASGNRARQPARGDRAGARRRHGSRSSRSSSRSR